MDDRRAHVLSPLGVTQNAGVITDPRLVPLHVLLTLSWVLAAGMGAALLIVFFRSGLHPNLVYPAFLIAIFCALTLYMRRGWRPSKVDRDWVSNREAGALLALIMAFLTAFFVALGGILNPFVILLFAPVTVSATALSQKITGGLVLWAIGLLGLLTLTYLDLPWRNRTGAVDALILPLDYRAATWTALVISLVFLSLFLSWQADLNRRTARALEASRLALEREQTLANIGGLAAAAAHELGSPLATIAVTARDMADMLQDGDADDALIADANLLVEETLRCRKILTQLATPPDAAEAKGHAPFLAVDLEQIVMSAHKAHSQPNVRLQIIRDGADNISEPIPPRQGELVHSLSNIIQNAVQFARSEVRAIIAWDEQFLTLKIQDDGPGYSATVLEQLGQPYVKGPASERPSMGLGLFIASSLLRHAGAEVTFGNRSDGQIGAEVSLSWSLPISSS